MTQPNTPLKLLNAIEDMYAANELGSTGAIEEEDEIEARMLELEQQISEQNASLTAANDELTRAHAEARQVGDYLGRMNATVERRAGGDWKEIALLLASSAVGLGLGYVLQKTMDKRIPWVALAGVGLVAAGVVIRTRWSVRGSMVVGGAMLAGGSTIYVLTMPATEDPGVMMV